MKKILLLLLIISIYKVNAQVGTWVTKTPMGNDLTARTSAGMVAVNSKLYIFGGFNGCGPKDFSEYDPATGNFRKLKSFDFGCGNWHRKAIYSAQNKIYHFSGYGVKVYDISLNTWTTLGTLPAGLDPDGGFVINDSIFLVSRNGNNFFSYNVVTNGFTQRANYPGSPNRIDAQGFDINGMGYWGGGTSSGVFTSSFYEYNPVANSWTPKENLPLLIRGGVGESFNGKGYLGLGEYFDIPTSTLEMSQFWYEYDPVGDNWTQKQNIMNVSNMVHYSAYCLNNAAIANINDNIYVFGGTVRTNYLYRDNVYKYNVTTDNWTIRNWELGANRKEAAGFHINGKIYIVSGQDDESLNDFWEYDIAGDSWQLKDTLIPYLYYTQRASVDINGKGYLIGGYDKNISVGSRYIDSLKEYNPVTNTWTSLASYPGGERSKMAAFANNGNLYAGMGIDNNGVYKLDFYEYNPGSNTWSPKATLPAGFDGRSLSYFTLGDTAYVLTGAYTFTCYKYSFADNSWSSSVLPGHIHPASVYMNNGFAYNGKGYVVFINTTTHGDELAEYDPATGKWTKILNIPFHSSEQTLVSTSGGIYFGFGGEELSGQNTNTWRKLMFNQSVSRETGMFETQMPDYDYVNTDYLTCGTGSISEGSSHSIQDSIGNLFATVFAGTNTLNNFCFEVNSLDTSLAYRSLNGEFGRGYNEYGLFLNKSILLTGNNTNMPHNDGAKLRLYYTTSELNKFVQDFNVQFNANMTIDSIRFLQYFNYGQNDHDPLNNGQPGSNYKLYTTSFSNYGTEKYVDLISYATPYTIAGEIYAVLAGLNSPVSISEKDKPKASVYPNPAQSSFNLTMSNPDTYSVRILDSRGKLVCTKDFSGNDCMVDLTSCSEGLYYLVIRNSQGQIQSTKVAVSR